MSVWLKKMFFLTSEEISASYVQKQHFPIHDTFFRAAGADENFSEERGGEFSKLIPGKYHPLLHDLVCERVLN